jgi:predicted amidohydrolase
MNEKTIATVALRDEGCTTLQQTLQESSRWVEAAAAQGAHLAVLPETINLLHRKNDSVPLHEFALEDWQRDTALLCDTAARCGIALVLPLLVRSGSALANRFYVLAADGTPLGHYQKRAPAPGERSSGVEAGNTNPIAWEGLRIGGAICVDVYYPHAVFEPQMDAGADLFVIPSLTPAGILLDAAAVQYGVPFVLAYSSWSRILDCDGTELAAGGYRVETLRAGFGSPVVQATINFDAVTLFADFNQDRMQDVQRQYGRKVRIRFSQPNCIFTLESRSPDLSVRDIMREFGLVSRRNYFKQNDPASRQRVPTATDSQGTRKPE